jgi:signal transduction histidine kinase
MEIRPVRVQVDDLIELVAAGFAPLAEQKGLALQLQPGAGVRTIASDPQRLEQILSNFVANAIKFTARGAITIETRVSDGPALATEGYRFLDEHADGGDPVLMLAVHDTGIGIRTADLGRLAEDFRQLDEAVEGRYGGTGLGLSIARKMADLLDGRIAVRSAHGRGSTFALVLPLPAARQRAAA